MRITRNLLGLVLLASAMPAAAQETHHEWVATRYEASLFDDDTEAWHYASLEAGARRTRLTSIARVNWASRFGEDGYQLEADVYPAWPGVGYAYVSGAWSPDAPFPELRLAAEAFASLPSAFEASAGVIWLDFANDVTIVVGSLSKYTGNYWLAVRPSWVTGEGDLALALIARRYLRTPGEYVTLRLLGGTTPEEIATRGSTSLETIGAQADGQIEVSRRFLVLPLAAVAREELPSGDSRMRYSVGIGGMLRF